MKIKTFCTALLLLPALASAGVNTKNGNFYITYRDFVQESNEHELDINRTYNSKATEVGWFGFGWGSIFETRMIVMPDGSVVVHEQGAGRENYYAPEDSSQLQAGVDKIVAVVAERDKLDQEAAAGLRQKLLANADLRKSTILKYSIQAELPEGVTAQLSGCSVITRHKDEYQRTTCEDSNYFGSGTDYFDLAGRLIRHEEGDYKFTIHYAGKHPDRIEDSLGQKVFLVWNTSGHVQMAWPGTGKPVETYSYDESGNLLIANEIGGNFYRYQYDTNHNMTQIGYIDNTHMDMQYDEKSLITSVAETDGSKTTYAYRTDPNNESHYWTTITRTEKTGEQSSREHEYSLTTDAAGVERLASMSRGDGQRKQDIVLDEQGRVKRVNRPDGGFAEYTYHPKLNKVSAVVTDEGKTEFEYNKAGNLTRAKNSHGQLITLGYDSKKQISRMIETDESRHTQRELTFKYNAQGKPTKIELAGQGEISVEYDGHGEISSVESKQGAKMALQVTEAFQMLLSVVKVGGVDLGM